MLLPRAVGKKIMKKIYFALFLMLLTLCPVLAIEENINPQSEQNNSNYAPIYLDESEIQTPSFFSKIRKDEIYTLDNYKETLKSSSANIDVITRVLLCRIQMVRMVV